MQVKLQPLLDCGRLRNDTPAKLLRDALNLNGGKPLP
jgi:hypothetical protein